MVSSSASRRVRFDRFELDLDSGELWREGVSVDLPPQPSRILAILVEGAGTLVGRVELRQRSWGEDWLDWEASLHQAIRRIRVALGDSATEPRFIETMPRRGYRFVAQVEAVGPVQRAAPIERRHPRARSVSRRSWLSFSAAGTIALVAVLSVVFLATADLRPGDTRRGHGRRVNRAWHQRDPA